MPIRSGGDFNVDRTDRVETSLVFATTSNYRMHRWLLSDRSREYLSHVPAASDEKERSARSACAQDQLSTMQCGCAKAAIFAIESAVAIEGQAVTEFDKGLHQSLL